jgi:hypothetical protein
MHHSWTCRCCGKQSNELPLHFASWAPDPWLELTEEERSKRGKIDSDICMIDRQFFVRGCLDLPIIGHDPAFLWSVWVSVAESSLLRILDLWNAEVQESEPPLFGWLCKTIYGYPETYGLKTNIHLRNNRRRPFIELEPTEHPLPLSNEWAFHLAG